MVIDLIESNALFVDYVSQICYKKSIGSIKKGR